MRRCSPYRVGHLSRPSRPFGISPLMLGSGGTRQPFARPRRLKFGSDLQPVPTTNTIRSYPTLPEIPFRPTPRPSDKQQADGLTTLRKRQSSEGPMLLYYQIPLLLVEGRGQYLFDDQGHRYLDMFGFDGVTSVGHCHPDVAEAVKRQATQLTHLSHHFLSEQITEFNEALLTKMPPELNSVFLVSSESEATELSFLLARLYTKNHDLLSLRGSYFGLTHLANSLSGMSSYKFPVPQAHGVIHLGTPDFFRNSVSSRQAVEFSIKEMVSTLRAASSGAIAGCVIEAIQSLPGAVPINSRFLKQLCQMVRSRGGLIIMDEGASGMGRLGSHFWGFQHCAIQPDIVMVTKGLANGLPFAAIVTKQEIAASLRSRAYTNVYAGNPICCVAATAVLKAIETDGLQDNAAYQSSYLYNQLCLLQKKYPELIGNVTAVGLNAGIEFVKNAVTKEPAIQVVVDKIHESMKNRGVIIGKGGYFGNVLRLSPPLCIIREDIEYLVGQLDAVLAQLQRSEKAIDELSVRQEKDKRIPSLCHSNGDKYERRSTGEGVDERSMLEENVIWGDHESSTDDNSEDSDYEMDSENSDSYEMDSEDSD